MEELIKQAFLHVDVIGPHVQQGHYDLLGPDQQIILPQVWDKVIEPDWNITMVMWPMDRPSHAGIPGRPGMPPGFPGMPGLRPPGIAMPGQRPGGRPQAGPPPPPHHPGLRPLDPRMAGGRGGPTIVTVEPKKKKSSKTASSGMSGFLGFGKPAKK